jgi:hypothetical protein
MENAPTVEVAAATLKVTLPALRQLAARHHLGAMHDRLRRGGHHREAAHPGFKDMTGLVLWSGAIEVIRRAPNEIGNARWRVRFTACAHEYVYHGLRIRAIEKAGRAPQCPTCKLAAREASAHG